MPPATNNRPRNRVKFDEQPVPEDWAVKMRIPHSFRWILLTTMVVFFAAATLHVQTPKSVWDGVYTAAQAKEGQAVFRTVCAECHGADLAGIEQAPPLAGSAFVETWKGATLRKLYDTVEQMPPESPKSLTAKQYVDVVAYVLSVNEFPAGETALVGDRRALGDVAITGARPEKKGQ
jgi:mono/diheme cytochrome c family protein